VFTISKDFTTKAKGRYGKQAHKKSRGEFAHTCAKHLLQPYRLREVGIRIVTQCDALGYIYMSLSGSGVNGGYSFNQRVALGYICSSL